MARHCFVKSMCMDSPFLLVRKKRARRNTQGWELTCLKKQSRLQRPMDSTEWLSFRLWEHEDIILNAGSSAENFISRKICHNRRSLTAYRDNNLLSLPRLLFMFNELELC